MKEMLQAGIHRVFYLHEWKHPDAAYRSEYERLQSRFLQGVRRLEMADLDAEWAVSTRRAKT
jgi:dCMP deaminase